MDFYQIFSAIEQTGLAQWVRESILALPIINALHVVGVALVFGTISIVDMRLIGFQSVTRRYSYVADELLKWTWIGFAFALATGLLMFAANATTFYVNTQFWVKMGFLALAGINMFVFELVTVRSVKEWDDQKITPPAARLAGFASLTFWTLVIIFGRWIGYSKGFNFDMPTDVNIDDLFKISMLSGMNIG
jgi:hypothetical protein